jgi:hypothetical protein
MAEWDDNLGPRLTEDLDAAVKETFLTSTQFSNL